MELPPATAQDASGVPPKPRGSLGYIPALDGCRAVSILIVMLSHFGYGGFMPGLLGVTIFFVISGYLITGLLLDEAGRTGGINLRTFYIRRGIRLYPAMLAMVAVGAGVYWLLDGPLQRNDVLSAVFYWSNYHYFPESAGPHGVLHPFLVLWSLAIEEHFYLLFPFLVLFLHKRLRMLGFAILIAIAAVTLWRFHIASVCGASPAGGLCALPSRVAHGTDTRMDAILYGCLLAVAVRLSAERARQLLNSYGPAVVAVLLIGVSLGLRSPYFRETTRFTLQPAAIAVLIGCLVYGARFQRVAGWLAHPHLVRIGRWSYSLYLWHSVVLTLASGLLARHIWLPILESRALRSPASMAMLPVLLAASFALAALSYRFVEQPTLALRRRFGSHAGDRPDAAQDKGPSLVPVPAVGNRLPSLSPGETRAA